MGQVLWLIFALAFGALLGTTLHPGALEIAIVALALGGCANGYRAFNQRKRPAALGPNG